MCLVIIHIFFFNIPKGKKLEKPVTELGLYSVGVPGAITYNKDMEMTKLAAKTIYRVVTAIVSSMLSGQCLSNY